MIVAQKGPNIPRKKLPDFIKCFSNPQMPERQQPHESKRQLFGVTVYALQDMFESGRAAADRPW